MKIKVLLLIAMVNASRAMEVKQIHEHTKSNGIDTLIIDVKSPNALRRSRDEEEKRKTKIKIACLVAGTSLSTALITAGITLATTYGKC